MQGKPVFILPLSDVSAGLFQVGGKAASLARMSAAGLPVPPGFTITTDAYRRFLVEHGLQAQILAAVALVKPDQPGTLEDASCRVACLFEQSAITEIIASEIRQA